MKDCPGRAGAGHRAVPSLHAAGTILGRRCFLSPFLRKLDPGIECQLQIRNLSEYATEDDLRALFARAGDVMTVKIIRDPHTGTSRGYAYVTMSAQSEADTAVSRLDDHPLLELNLKVSLVKARMLRADFIT